jgi:cell division protein FtsZ
LNIEIPEKSNQPEKIVVALGDANANITNSAPAPVAAETPKAAVDTMAPTLVEMPVAEIKTVVIDAKPAFPQVTEQKEMFVLDAQSVTPVAEVPATKAEEPAAAPVVSAEETIQLVIKNEAPATPVQETPVMKVGERVLTADEIEEKQRFEDQKRALEERAERLRRMSFNIKTNESSDDVENVPAYVRRNMQIDNNGVASSDTFYSGYTVGMNDQQNNTQASIQTINTFLDGKKPD